jgi:hypothetical protein
MKSSFVEKLRGDAEETQEQSRFFGFEPQPSGRALMFELRTRDGRRSALPYSYVTRADFNPEKGIEIYVSNVVVLIKGRGLEDIFAYFLQNRLMWLREDSAGTDIDEEGVFVESLEVKLAFEGEA